MKHSEVLSRYVNTGGQIPEEQYDRLTPSLKKSYFRIRGVVGYENWEFKLLNDNEKINYIGIKGEKLSSEDIKYIVKNSINNDPIATKIIDVKGEKLNSEDIFILIIFSKNKDDIATKIIQVKGEKLVFGNIYDLLEYSVNKDDIATKIIQVKGEKLDDNDIYNLLKYSNDKDKTATKIIEKKGKGLTKNDIYDLLFHPKDKELIKKTLLQNGVDYKLINNVINKHNRYNDLKILLIPDNYQSMLNEIKRIKEIMI